MRAGTTLSAPLSGSAISSIPAEPPLWQPLGQKLLANGKKYGILRRYLILKEPL